MLLTIFLTIFALLTKIHCAATEDTVTAAEQTPATNSTQILEATASKLVRYRSKHPNNHYRYKAQAFKRPRPRIKSQKGKYGPPIYTMTEPSGYNYKQQPKIYTSTQSYKPSYSYDEVHYEVSSEYPFAEKPLSNYEKHAMDLEFNGDSYSKKKTPQRYQFSKPQKAYSISRPHEEYGIPKGHSFDDYSGDEYASKPKIYYDVSYHEEPLKGGYGPPEQKDEYTDFPPYGPPPKQQISYQVPDNKYELPVNSYHPQEQLSPEGPYPEYNKKLPNVEYTYSNNFAEPPTDIHITYSPSYDINLSPANHMPHPNNYKASPSNDYGPPTDNYGPPEYKQNYESNYQAPSDSYYHPSGGNFAEPPHSYHPPIHHQDELPLKTNHMPPGYDYPKTSYEVPIYDPIPFESSTADHDYFPPNHIHTDQPHEHVSESNNHIQRIVPSKPSTTTTTSTTIHEPVQQANSKVHRFTPRKHRFKHVNRHELTSQLPLEPEELYSSQPPSVKYLDKIPFTTTSTFRPRRKRKRTKAPVIEKHNLDTPELQEGFESASEHLDEPAAHESNIKENVEPIRQSIRKTAPVQAVTEFSPSQSWNPMRIRTKNQNAQRGQRTAEVTLNDLKNVDILSIQKSNSHSYYAGTVPPRTRTLSSRADAVKMSTNASTAPSQTTKKFILDKTYFKGKTDKEDYYDGTGELPKKSQTILRC